MDRIALVERMVLDRMGAEPGSDVHRVTKDAFAALRKRLEDEGALPRREPTEWSLLVNTAFAASRRQETGGLVDVPAVAKTLRDLVARKATTDLSGLRPELPCVAVPTEWLCAELHARILLHELAVGLADSLAQAADQAHDALPLHRFRWQEQARQVAEALAAPAVEVHAGLTR